MNLFCISVKYHNLISLSVCFIMVLLCVFCLEMEASIDFHQKYHTFVFKNKSSSCLRNYNMWLFCANDSLVVDTQLDLKSDDKKIRGTWDKPKKSKIHWHRNRLVFCRCKMIRLIYLWYTERKFGSNVKMEMKKAWWDIPVDIVSINRKIDHANIYTYMYASKVNMLFESWNFRGERERERSFLQSYMNDRILRKKKKVF